MLTTSSLEPPPNSDEDALEQEFAIVTLDYEQTVGLLGGVVQARMALRALIATAYVTLLALGIEQHSEALPFAAAAGAFLGAMNDLYLGWVYQEALLRANSLERLFQHRMRALDRAYDPYPAERLRVELERYDFGVYTTFPQFRRDRLLPSIRWAMVVVYIAATAAAVVCGFVAR